MSPVAVEPAVKVTIESTVDPVFIQHCNTVDIFHKNTIGYWACGMLYEPELGWLIYEHSGERNAPLDPPPNVMKAWRNGKVLPKRWHQINAAAISKAWAEGVKLHGEKWYANGDAHSTDSALQLAILGEFRYG